MNPQCPRADCIDRMETLDIPAASLAGKSKLYQCAECKNVYRQDGVEFVNVTKFFERMALGDDRIHVAMSDEHQVSTDGIMQLITEWRATTEMGTLAFIGAVQQRLGQLDNRLHSIKKRLAESLLGEPTPLDTNQMLRLVDECIDLASPAPARERGITRKHPSS